MPRGENKSNREKKKPKADKNKTKGGNTPVSIFPGTGSASKTPLPAIGKKPK